MPQERICQEASRGKVVSGNDRAGVHRAHHRSQLRVTASPPKQRLAPDAAAVLTLCLLRLPCRRGSEPDRPPRRASRHDVDHLGPLRMKALRGSRVDPPFPPRVMRQLVGPTEDEAFDNPTGELVYRYLPTAAYRSVFDFGCGCGRVARQLIQQRERPERYVGIDLHRGMIEWCKSNLAPYAHGFEFFHHDVFNSLFNPDRSKPDSLPFPSTGASATLVNAHSVFTHL